MERYKNREEIAILMTTYNGGAYLPEQIESLINQSFSSWRLFIHDDGSSDNTLEIIHNYELMDNRIVLVNDMEKHLGACRGFMYLLSIIDSELYMFCDQDDVWLNDKISLSVDEYKAVYEPGRPIVVHTDMSVVDSSLKIMAESYWRGINLDPDKINSLPYLYVCCYTNGNTMLFNKIAKNCCFPLAEDMGMHDLYVSSCVMKNNGIVHATHKSTVLYRQHGRNVCGVSVGKELFLINKLKSIGHVLSTNYRFYKSYHRRGCGNILNFIKYKALVEIHMHYKNNY